VVKLLPQVGIAGHVIEGVADIGHVLQLGDAGRACASTVIETKAFTAAGAVIETGHGKEVGVVLGHEAILGIDGAAAEVLQRGKLYRPAHLEIVFAFLNRKLAPGRLVTSPFSK